MKSKERAEVLLAIAAICLFTASLLPVFFKTLFVESTGSFKIISPWIIGVLVLAYLFKQYWFRRLALFVCRFQAIFLAIIIAIEGFRNARTFSLCLLLAFILAAIYILEDKEVRYFLDARTAVD